MPDTRPSGHRQELLEAAGRFVSAASRVPGVRTISLLGSIVTNRPDPKDIDLLVVVSDEADLAVLATHARRLQGRAQQFNRGADVFLANDRGEYIGRTCRWKDCRPGIRASCDALHCGRRPHLHDDFNDIRLSNEVVQAPPLTVWPEFVRRCALPQDVDQALAQFHTPSNTALHPTGAGGIVSAGG